MWRRGRRPISATAAKGNKDARFSYAFVWSGTAASGLNIHAAMAVNGTTPFANSYALAVEGPWVVGYAVDNTKFGTPASSHAIVWDADYQPIDLNAFLPAGFVGAIAQDVDAQGQSSGVIYTAEGRRHAALWVPTAPSQP
jgi:hypothetical protein